MLLYDCMNGTQSLLQNNKKEEYVLTVCFFAVQPQIKRCHALGFRLVSLLHGEKHPPTFPR